MSRVGKAPIELPKEAKTKFEAGTVTVEGPKGKLSHKIPKGISIDIADNKIQLTRATDDRRDRAMHGLTRTLLANMVEGVTLGFKKQLEIVGVGYRAEKSGKSLSFSLGYSSPVVFDVPEGIQLQVDKQIVAVTGIDKCLVGQTASKIRSLRKPDPYKGKGIRYLGEIVRTKVGKTGAK